MVVDPAVMPDPPLHLHLWPEPYGVASLRSLPAGVGTLRRDGPPVGLAVGHDAISLLAPEALIDALGDAVERHERGWRALTLDAVFEPSAVGLLAEVARTLASVGVPVLVISGLDTEHVPVPAARIGHALTALGQVELERFLQQ
jgi:hypothetical protein